MGRLSCLKHTQRVEVFAAVRNAQLQGQPWTMGQILDHTIPVHHVVLDNLKEKTGRKSCIATAMTDKRLEIDPAAIAQYFESLNQTVSGAPAHFVSNMRLIGK